MPTKSSEVNDRDGSDLGNPPHTPDLQAKSNGHQGKHRRRIHKPRGTSWITPQPEAGQSGEQSVDSLSTLSSIWSGNLTRFVLKDKTNECRKDNYVKWPSVTYQRSRHYQVYVQRGKACYAWPGRGKKQLGKTSGPDFARSPKEAR